MDIRKIVQKQLDRLEWTRGRLVKELAGEVPATTVYEFLAGTSNIGQHHLGKIFDVIGLTITAK